MCEDALPAPTSADSMQLTVLERIFLNPTEAVMKELLGLLIPIQNIVMREYNGELLRFYPVLQQTIEHAKIREDPEPLQLVFFYAMSAIPGMQTWARGDADVLRPERRGSFFDQLEALTRDLSCRVIDVHTYVTEICNVLMMGQRTHAFRLPRARRGTEWPREFASGDLPDPALVDGAAVDAAMAMHMMASTEAGGDSDDGDDAEGIPRSAAAEPPKKKKQHRSGAPGGRGARRRAAPTAAATQKKKRGTVAAARRPPPPLAD